VVGVLVSVGDHGGGGGERSVGDAGEGESSEIQLIKSNREIHGASDAKRGRTISSAHVPYSGSCRNARGHPKAELLHRESARC